MPNVALKDIQLAIKDGIGSDIYDSNETVENKRNYFSECDMNSLLERRNQSCLAFY